MQNPKTKDFLVHAILFICVIGLLAGYLFLLRDFANVKNSSSTQTNTSYTGNLNLPSNCDETCKAQIEAQIESKLKSVTLPEATPTSVPTSTPVVSQATQTTTSSTTKTTTYIPFSSSFSTTSTDWVTATGNETYIDLKNNYSSNAYVTFEASIRTNPGGEIFARLYDSTHGIAVDGSEISTASTSSLLVSSGKLNLWSGNNLYKVQIKSLNSFNVTFDSARIKLVY